MQSYTFVCACDWSENKKVNLARNATSTTAQRFTVQMPILTNPGSVKKDTELILRWYVQQKKDKKDPKRTSWVDEWGRSEKKRRMTSMEK